MSADRPALGLSGRALGALACLAAACGPAPAPQPPAPLVPLPNAAREIVHTGLAVDVTALTGTATLTFGPSKESGATLEIGDLAIERVQLDGKDLAHSAGRGRLVLALPAATGPLTVVIAYRWRHHPLQGASPDGFTVLWPHFCGNLFPCHSLPADGSTFSLELAGVPAGKTAVFPATISAEAPAYQLAWSIDDYVEHPLGATTAGTRLFVWHTPGEAARARAGAAHLLAAFDWLERTIGPYRFGPKAGTVHVRSGPGSMGGMEHHPFWHVDTALLDDGSTQIHEAAHGWFGSGVRVRCWEDFVLSEGTVTYLTARALDAVAPDAGAALWQRYEQGLDAIEGAWKVWPQGCSTTDMLADGLFTNAPYLRGAFFYRGVALRVGAEALDRALAAFYAAHATRASTMAEMLATIRRITGYDPAACAERWLRSATKPVPGACS